MSCSTFSTYLCAIALWTCLTAAQAQQHVLGVNAASKKNPFDEDFEKLVNETLDHWKVPGVAIAVIDGDNVWAEGYGYATLPSKPVTPETLFMVGSSTKAFTASLMSMFVDDEAYPEIQWSSPVSSIIRDDFVLADDYATSHITIEDILSHRSGLPRHELAYGGDYEGETNPNRGVVRALRHLPLTAEIRTTFQYCNPMYVVASYIMEFVTGRWLGDLLNDKIWKPLNMTSTYFTSADALKSENHYATSYYWDDATQTYVEVPHPEYKGIAGAGSIISNVLDFSSWISSLLERSGPISEAGHTAVRSPRSIVPAVFSSQEFTGSYLYGLGWFLGVYAGLECINHGGSTENSGAEVIFFPEIKYGVVTFANTQGTSNSVGARLAWQLINDKLGVPEEKRVDIDKKNDDKYSELREMAHNALNVTYPKIADPPLPLSLPVSAYAGSYYHPGYRDLVLYEDASESSPRLLANRLNAAWAREFTFDHVSGENWIAYWEAPDTHVDILREFGAAEFKVSETGKVTALGINLESSMGPDGRIWFDRIGN